MRKGFTTGSCAAAAAKASAYMLLTGKIKNQIKIITPAGIEFPADIVDIVRKENEVSSAVIKDGGDDPDVTSGCHVVARVSFPSQAFSEVDEEKSSSKVHIKGGRGVGLVTLPGLDQKVGMSAINSVPRLMIEKEVLEVCSLCDFKGSLNVEISVTEGEELAEKTFNPRLGIKGGISILGTSGIVEPMSSQALLDTIKVELGQKKELGNPIAVISPGNYGLDFMKENFDFDLDGAVKCSNFIGDTIDFVLEKGFDKLLLVGHIGKLIKLSGGIMNTHSREGDCRLELLAVAAFKAGCKNQTINKILSSISCEEGCKIIKEESLEALNKTMKIIMEKILFYMERRAHAAGRENKLQIECMTFCNSLGLLAESSCARLFIDQARDFSLSKEIRG